MCVFFFILRPCYTRQFSQQFVSQCRCKTSFEELHRVTGVVAQFFLLREALHEVGLGFTFRHGLQQMRKQRSIQEVAGSNPTEVRDFLSSCGSISFLRLQTALFGITEQYFNIYCTEGDILVLILSDKTLE